MTGKNNLKNSKMSKIFTNQTAIISGGLGDIGFAIAREFARQGASIAIGDLVSSTDARKFMSKLEHLKIRCHYCQVDVTDARAVQEWIDEVEHELDIPTIIIANAATATPAGVHKITPEQWSRELRVNLDGAFYLTQATTSRLREKEISGRVVFIGSWAAHAVHTNLPAYCVSKAGMRMLSKCMALELAPHNILVNEVAPGYVDAGLSGRVWKEKPDLRKQAVKKVPIKKLISAEAVAEQVVQLCHPKNEHTTGSTFLMDGGLSLLS